MRNVLIISGLDPSGGAGFIADVRLAQLHGCRAVGTITAVTEQDTTGVRAMHPVNADDLSAVLTTLLTDIEIHAVKLGMLGTVENAEVIGDALALTAAPVVWDPVLLPSRGSVPFLVGDLRRAVVALARHVTVVTPNRAELGVLGGGAVADLSAATTAARRIAEMGMPATLIKGGHFDTSDSNDYLFDNEVITELAGNRVSGISGGAHGTGCALSTVIACRLALGDSLLAACVAAKREVTARLTTPVRVGQGRPSVM